MLGSRKKMAYNTRQGAACKARRAPREKSALEIADVKEIAASRVATSHRTFVSSTHYHRGRQQSRRQAGHADGHEMSEGSKETKKKQHRRVPELTFNHLLDFSLLFCLFLVSVSFSAFSFIPPIPEHKMGLLFRNASWMTTGEFSHQILGTITKSTDCIKESTEY